MENSLAMENSNIGLHANLYSYTTLVALTQSLLLIPCPCSCNSYNTQWLSLNPGYSILIPQSSSLQPLLTHHPSGSHSNGAPVLGYNPASASGNPRVASLDMQHA
eukprot:scaffold67904_cov21-Tisochrysis_lutea.AAC.1